MLTALVKMAELDVGTNLAVQTLAAQTVVVAME
jgi:hypothetical protein